MKTKSFISEDAIQRIASGNEPSQTLISMDVLKNVLNPHQLRNVLGGSDGTGDSGGSGSGCACWTSDNKVKCCSSEENCDEVCYKGCDFCCGPCGLATNNGCW